MCDLDHIILFLLSHLVNAPYEIWNIGIVISEKIWKYIDGNLLYATFAE